MAEREPTHVIARRLRDSIARPRSLRERLHGLARYFAEGLTCFTPQDERDFVELIRRATAGEYDRENGRISQDIADA